MKTEATSKSFQTQKNWKISTEAIAGVDSGRTILRKTGKWVAPSMRAASKRSAGSWEMELQQEDRERQGEHRVGDPDGQERRVRVRCTVYEGQLVKVGDAGMVAGPGGKDQRQQRLGTMLRL